MHNSLRVVQCVIDDPPSSYEAATMYIYAEHEINMLVNQVSGIAHIRSL